ncbi:homeobox and C2H2 transcription factor [Parachaetomium inaequale]|uniref:Homeobox and C2H2 transcription factor n=1 Tax=Parachaetomium inaequale TaxID=2588326 RepID=A0AAN6PRK4_9PEZI|nr:homeobox and C2H2 transcription factor [Parachaetomium inaequale]
MADRCPDQPLHSDDDWGHWLPCAYPDPVSDFACPTPQPENDWGSLEMGDGKPPGPTNDGSTTIPPSGDFVNVAGWLDGAYRPPVPCAYCQQHRLQCLVIRTTNANPNPVTSCSSCVALFRECSLARGEKRHPAGFETVFPVFNHLHGVTEWTDDELVSGPHALPVPEPHDGQAQSARGRDMTEEGGQHKQPFSRKGAKVLRDWFDRNQHDPYPTDGQKAAFVQQTGLTEKQISTWFANARRRRRMAQRTSRPAQVCRSGSPMPIARSAALTPIERWQRSPPDQEPASESAIQQAIAAAGTDAAWNCSSTSADASSASHWIASSSSISSIDSGLSHDSSESFSSTWSHQSESYLPFPLSDGRRPRSQSRRRRPTHRSAAGNPYQCTFCVDSFKKKHDWVRHEKSVHLSLESWICSVAPPGVLDLAGSDASPCDFCSASALTESHFSTHEFDVCTDRPLAERSFRRKDHLVQHFRKFHHCTTIPALRVEACRTVTDEVQSRCGFCQLVMPTWAARADHLAEHFKNGQRMADWSGDWGFDPMYQVMLRHTIPPADRPGYLEAVS